MALSLSPSQAQPFVEASLGDYPVILSAPHGGYLTPDSLRDRTCAACVTVRDSRTQEWARHLSDEIFLLTGRRPYFVINLLARVKLDANRNLPEATDGDEFAGDAWADFHGALDAASADVTTRFGAGLVLDLHGHGHPILRFELGYLLSAATLRTSDMALEARSGPSSVANLAARANGFTQLIRGPDSFGELLERQGVAATPSLSDPAPRSGESFFSGGYITARHGSRDGGAIDAIQLEAYYRGARDSNTNVVLLARDVARAVVGYMDRWYGAAVGTALEEPTRVRETDCLTASALPDGIWIEVASACELGSVQVRLSDLLGRTVARTVVTRSGRLDARALAAGVYFAIADGLQAAVPVVVY